MWMKLDLQYDFEKENVRVFPDTVVHRIHTNTVRDLQYFLRCILLGVQNDVVRTVALREFNLGIRRRPDKSGGSESGEERSTFESDWNYG